MDLNQIPLFAMLKGKMTHSNTRQRIISENVANADVPNYAPRDLKPFTFSEQLERAQSAAAVEPVRTSAAHMELPEAPSSAAASDSVKSPDSEVRLDGNHVVLEEQMVKLTEERMNYDAVVGFYQQSLGLLKTAIQRPGG